MDAVPRAPALAGRGPASGEGTRGSGPDCVELPVPLVVGVGAGNLGVVVETVVAGVPRGVVVVTLETVLVTLETVLVTLETVLVTLETVLVTLGTVVVTLETVDVTLGTVLVTFETVDVTLETVEVTLEIVEVTGSVVGTVTVGVGRPPARARPAASPPPPSSANPAKIAANLTCRITEKWEKKVRGSSDQPLYPPQSGR
jgi:hypothetical protein